MATVSSESLDAFATVPHCLDNQYLPLEALTRLHSRRINQAAAERERTRSVRREYMRSLLYSPTVIVNRAFALNEPAVHGEVHRYPKAVADMISRGRLVFLLLRNETGLDEFLDTDVPPFPISRDGRRAWKSYLKEFGSDQVRYLQLANVQNQAIVERFPRFVRALLRQEFNSDSFTALRTAAGIADGRVDEFRAYLDSSKPWLDGVRDGLNRTVVYEQFILPPGADISRPGIDPAKPFSVEMKLLVDLAYNHNLPTTLIRQSFVPSAMPNPLCLPPDIFHPGSGAVTLNNEGLARALARDSLASRLGHMSQESFLVPDWADLSIADVNQIQSWPEWEAFQVAQARLVDVASASEFLRRLDEFFGALQDFQRHLAKDIQGDVGALRHLARGARVLRLVVAPVVTWAGAALTPEKAVIVRAMVKSAEFALDIIIDFFDARADVRENENVNKFVLRTVGVQRNVQASIREDAELRREIEKLSEEAAAPAAQAPAQTV